MKIGLYFGSFNPIHIGHLIIANHLLNSTKIDKVWFVISPQNPFKSELGLLDEYSRLHLVRLAIEDDNRIKASDIEFHLPKPSFTIMGSDSFQNIHKWKNYQTITKNYSIYVYKRPGFEIENSVKAKLYIVEAPLLQISATEIRKLIKEKKSVRYMLPEKVFEEIEKGNYYRK